MRAIVVVWMMVMAVAIAVPGCVASSSVDCPGGLTCPESTACAVVNIGGTATPMCVLQEQLSSCATSPVTCEGTCHDGVCLPNVCGNLLVDNDEVCDSGDDNGRVDLASRCSLDCQSNMTCGNRTVDVASGEACDEGDFLSHDGCSSTCGRELPRWVELDGAPRTRYGARMAYDAQRGRTVLFGGSANTTSELLSDTYEWDGVRWYQIQTLTTPPVRSNHAMTYDSVRQRVVMFSGGLNGADTWTYDGEWRLENPAGEIPPSRSGASFAFDTNRGVAVLFGGAPATGIVDRYGDTWEWDGDAWHPKPLAVPNAPGPRINAAMAYDPKRGVVVLFGGRGWDGGYVDFDDTWEFDGATWTKKNIAGPPSRFGAAMAFDPNSQKLVLVGGVLPATNSDASDSWTFDGTQWTAVGAPATITRYPAMTTDTNRGVLVLTGNYGADVFEGGAGTLVNRLQDVNFGQRPQPRGHAAVAMHVADRTLVVFGGIDQDQYQTYQGTDRGDSLTFDGVWHGSVGTVPSARHWAAIAYDAKRAEVVMFSGCLFQAGSNDVVDDGGTWIFTKGQWSKRLSGSLPPPLCGAAMAWDDTRERLVMFGGRDANYNLTDDTWTWNGVDWQLEAPATRPPARWIAAMAGDPVRNNVVLYSGVTSSYDVVHGDTWVWDGTTWTQLAIDATPGGRRHAALAWDAARQRVVMLGGLLLTPAVDDDTAWEWDGARWDVVSAPSRGGRSAVGLATALDGGVLAFGGFAGGGGTNATNDLWQLQWGSSAPADVCTNTDIDGDGLAGCADPDCWYACTPSCSPGQDCSAAPRLCGDGVCELSTENCATCSTDCSCPVVCGNLVCDAGESAATCPGDCP